jgi:predicted small integral membrane protein
MLIRWLKIDLAVFIALFCLFYAMQNLFNLQSAHWFVSSVLSMEGHELYPGHFGPAITSPTLAWIALWVIIVLEFLAGALALKGAWDMWGARNDSAEAFQQKKRCVMASAGVALVIWFGLFSAVGGAYFQMWQTEAGTGALQGSFWYFAGIALVALYINSEDPD